MKGKLTQISAIFALVVILSTAASADPSWYGTHVAAGDRISSRSVANPGELTDMPDGGSPDGTLEWEITFSGGLWHYTYTFSDFGHDVSHVTFDLSDAFANKDSGVMQNVVLKIGNDDHPWPIEYGDLDGIVGAGKVDNMPENNTDGFVITFESTNAPMWGDIYIKDGKHFVVTNYNYLNHLDDDSRAGYVAVPDSVTVPLPSAVVLGSLGLGFAGWLRRKQNA